MRTVGCPWYAFHDPFVGRVLAAHRFFESGQLAYYAPSPSHRLVEGVAYFHGVLNVLERKQFEQDQEERKRKRASDEARMRADRR